MSNFSFSHSVFKRLVSQGRQKMSLCGNGLSPHLSEHGSINEPCYAKKWLNPLPDMPILGSSNKDKMLKKKIWTNGDIII